VTLTAKGLIRLRVTLYLAYYYRALLYGLLTVRKCDACFASHILHLT